MPGLVDKLVRHRHNWLAQIALSIMGLLEIPAAVVWRTPDSSSPRNGDSDSIQPRTSATE